MKTEEILYHLETVSNAMLEIQRYASEMDYNTFVEDEEARGIIAQHFNIIGHEAEELLQTEQNLQGDINLEFLKPLQKMSYHFYNEQDLHPVYGIIQEEIPEYIEEINQLSKQLDQPTE